LNSNGSTQVSEHEEGTYKILTLKGQREFFKVIRFINQGCYGKVFLVQHAATNFICCLKVIRKEGLDQQIRNQITREIAIQTFLHHPNIVAIYGFSHDEENVYLLLEPCLGGNLYDKITKEDPSEKEVATSVREACFALDFMHENDIIHRDIKPENILLHEGTAKVCDFGWAVHSPLLRNTQCGTPIYLSPEVVGSELYDTKVDVWSIGILTYELLYKKIPFEIKSLSDLTKIMHEDVQFSSERDVSSCAKDFIQRCLCKNPRRRLSIGEALDQNFLVGNHLKYRQTIA
jgi:aurora kinase